MNMKPNFHLKFGRKLQFYNFFFIVKVVVGPHQTTSRAACFEDAGSDYSMQVIIFFVLPTNLSPKKLQQFGFARCTQRGNVLLCLDIFKWRQSNFLFLLKMSPFGLGLIWFGQFSLIRFGSRYLDRIGFTIQVRFDLVRIGSTHQIWFDLDRIGFTILVRFNLVRISLKRFGFLCLVWQKNTKHRIDSL